MSGHGRSETKGLESVKVIGRIFPLNNNEAQSINLSRILRKVTAPSMRQYCNRTDAQTKTDPVDKTPDEVLENGIICIVAPPLKAEYARRKKAK